jgi:hypothetical protein
MIVTEKENKTIIFALEEYLQILEKQGEYDMRNTLLELIWKLDRARNDV